ncbi:hypothetical protein BD770DRAFT_477926 [Pilaira anomala]|nr:hypothetical protein BD770DRAFT_477926 [Pilaira anomala]
MDTLIQSLDKNNMKNKQAYKTVYYLSQKIRHQIEQLKSKIDIESRTFISNNDDDDDQWKVKSLPKLSIDSSVTITMHNDKKSSSVYLQTAFDSAVDLAINKPLPSIHHNKIKHTPIIHVKKKYCGLKGRFLTRSYQIHDIVVSRTILPYSSAYFVKLFASKDKLTGVDKAVLKITLTSSNTTNLFIIPDTPFTFHHLNTLTKLQKSQDLIQLSLVTDIQVQSALFSWLNYYQLQLPSIECISHVLREDLKIYIVYTINK